MFLPILINLYNIKERVFHLTTEREKDLIIKTNLFSKLDKKNLQELYRSLRLIKYAPGKLIFREGDIAECLYIILDGSVRVFTISPQGEKLSLARLYKGDFFGEQALLGRAHKARNANVEAITLTTLIIIDEKIISKILLRDVTTKKRLKHIGYLQATYALSLTSRYYNYIETLVTHIKKPKIFEFKKDEIIFSTGDQPDYIYIIVNGQIKILIPDQNIKDLILHKGHIFGELGVINNQPRLGTAIAHSDVRLIGLNRDEFKEYLQNNPYIEQILAQLKKVYQIPMKGSVEQFFGTIQEFEPIITSNYKLDDGRTVIASKFINQDVYTMYTVNVKGERYHQCKQGNNLIKLHINKLPNSNFVVTGIEAYGNWDHLPLLCHLLLDYRSIKDTDLTHFELTGTITNNNKRDAKVVCECLSVKRAQIQELINQGAKDLETITKVTGICTACRGCEERIAQMLGTSPWLSAVLKKTVAHTPNIYSYVITPLEGQFLEAKPGQHVVVQFKLHNHWIERTYTLSDVEKFPVLGITIKKDVEGFVSKWLIDEAPEELIINVSQPQGDFLLNDDPKIPAVCFAGGVGIAPFLTFAQTLAKTHQNKRMHLIYTALKDEDFIYMDKLNAIANQNPLFTILYKATDIEGYLSEDDIIKAVSNFTQPDIYICGPEPFIHLVRDTLQKYNLRSDRIHVEEFLHA